MNFFPYDDRFRSAFSACLFAMHSFHPDSSAAVFAVPFRRPCVRAVLGVISIWCLCVLGAAFSQTAAPPSTSVWHVGDTWSGTYVDLKDASADAPLSISASVAAFEKNRVVLHVSIPGRALREYHLEMNGNKVSLLLNLPKGKIPGTNREGNLIKVLESQGVLASDASAHHLQMSGLNQISTAEGKPMGRARWTLSLKKPNTGPGPATPAVVGTQAPALTPLPGSGVVPGGAAPAEKAPQPTQMKLHASWIPHNVHARQELLATLAFYSQAATKGGVTTPSVLWGDIKWLMPLDEALKTLPAGYRIQRTENMSKLAFPVGLSLTFVSLAGGPVVDRHNLFNEAVFITDLDRRVVSVQWVHNQPPAVVWENRRWDGIRDPYYNFLADKWNGKNGRNVRYQIRPGAPGVTLIKTVLPGSENVHWYLPAPLAEKLLEIAKNIGG